MYLNKKAIFTGSAIDLGLTFFSWIVVWSIADYWLIFRGVPIEQVRLTAHSSHMFMSALVATGLAFDFIGGFIAAKIAGHKHITHSAVASVPALVINALTYFNPFDVAYSALPLILCLPAYLYGGLVAKKPNPSFKRDWLKPAP